MNKNLERSVILNFEPQFIDLLPDTYTLLSSANLTVHPLVACVVLHGSRGLKGDYRPNSDIDISLIAAVPENQIADILFNEITEATLDNWRAAIELDLAVIFDIQKCGLKCFEQTTWQQGFCQLGGTDCFGLYKIQKGYGGFVIHAGIQVRLMYPCLKIWQREDAYM